MELTEFVDQVGTTSNVEDEELRLVSFEHDGADLFAGMTSGAG